jgi:ABC-2 type transport system ATP-binding protein
MKALNVKDLSHYYVSDWTRKKIPAVVDLTFDVNEAECFGFVGHNGSGKTTTIKNILGLVKTQSGKITIFGKPNKSIEAKAMLGYVSEQPYLYDSLTVNETMHFYATLAGISGRKRRNAVQESLEKVKFPKSPYVKLRTLSKGLTQKIIIAQAIVASPKLLILDEPFSGLDPIGRFEIRELFLSLKNDGTSIFLCSHALTDVELLCDRVAIMNQGKLVKTVSLKNTLESEFAETSFEIICAKFQEVPNELTTIAIKVDEIGAKSRFIFSKREEAEKVLKSLLESNIRVDSFTRQHKSLEEIFVSSIFSNK